MTLHAKRRPASVPLSTLPDVTRTDLSGPPGGDFRRYSTLLPQAGSLQTAGLQEFHLGTPGNPPPPRQEILGAPFRCPKFFIYWTCFYESPNSDPCSEFIAHASPLQ